MIANIPNIQVGIVGGTRSGKTLYLSCLRRFIDKNHKKITFQGANTESVNWLKDRTAELSQGILPTATLKKDDLQFNLRDTEGRVIEIKILDRQGWDYQATPDPELINYLSTCTGFIVLVDPLETLDNQSAFYRPLFDILSNSLQEHGLKINKRFSICLTKIDHPDFWNWYKKYKPSFAGIGPSGIFNKWFKDRGDEEDFTDSLKVTYGEENFQYHLISSIGFFDTGETSDSTNLALLLNEKGIEEGRLRNGKSYTPVNLYNPLYWAMGGNSKLK